MTRFLTGLFVFGFIVAKAQFSAKDFADKSSLNISFLVNSPTGSYKDKIKSTYCLLNSSGMSVQYLRNPSYKSNQESMVQVGAELGFVGRSQSNFFIQPNGNYYMTHREYWLNGVLKCRPILSPSKFNPFLEAYIGPKLHSSKMFETYGNNQADKLASFNSNTINFGLNFGIGYRISKINSPARYIDFGIGYSQSNGLILINPNKVGLDANYNVVASKIAINPQNLLFKIGITSYR